MPGPPEDQQKDDDSVTVIVSRKVKTGKEQVFNTWAAGISQDARKFEGYRGTKNIPPSAATNFEHVVIIKFDTYKNLKKWEDSPIRAAWIKKTGEFTLGDVKVQKLTGLEFWFSLPSHPLQHPPPRYKMAVVTFLALFPTILGVSLLVHPFLDFLPALLRTALSTLFTIILMTYAIMPLMTRIFAFWLFRSRKSRSH